MFEDDFKEACKGAYKDTCKRHGDEWCADGIGDYVYKEITAMGYPDDVASEVAQAATDALLKCVNTRKSVESDLTDEDQRGACKEAAGAAGNIAVEQ